MIGGFAAVPCMRHRFAAFILYCRASFTAIHRLLYGNTVVLRDTDNTGESLSTVQKFSPSFRCNTDCDRHTARSNQSLDLCSAGDHRNDAIILLLGML